MESDKVEANFSPDPLADNPNGTPVDAFVGDAPSSVAAPEAAVSNMDTTVPPATTMPTQGMETNSGWVSNNPSTNQTMSTNDIAFTNNAASMDGGQSKNSKTKLIIIIASVVAVIGIIVAVAVVVMNGQKNSDNKQSEQGSGQQESDEDSSESDRIDDIIVSTEYNIRDFTPEESYQYIDGQIVKYKDDEEVKTRLLILKAWVALNDDARNKALDIVKVIDADSLKNELKLSYYDLMLNIYKDNNKEKYLEYYAKYWGLYDEMFDYVGDDDE